MSDLKPGVYTVGDLTIMMLTDTVAAVCFDDFINLSDQERVRAEIQLAFPHVQRVIIGKGELSYKTLSESVELRDVIKSVVIEVVKENSGSIYSDLMKEKARRND